MARDRGELARKADIPLQELAAGEQLDRSTETLWTQVLRESWEHAVEKGVIEKPTTRKYQ